MEVIVKEIDHTVAWPTIIARNPSSRAVLDFLSIACHDPHCRAVVGTVASKSTAEKYTCLGLMFSI